MELPPFEELRKLAERDPQGFERLRAELIEDCISSCPPGRQRRLRGLQFVIDSRRRLASNPMHALVQIQSMMHEALDRLRRALNGQLVRESASCKVIRSGWGGRRIKEIKWD
ncbi:DUF3135 domain-containing protein [Marinobacter sp.]|uniref:DUF3135 domain-containing protein n=1 Tax=Marinobacter sp. TaxID=50741 RepID=UPI0038510C8C